MISAVRQPLEQYTQPPPRGTWGQRFGHAYKKRQTWPGWAWGGTGIIQGFIKIGSVGADNCRAVLLSEGHGALMDDVKITSGVYLFEHLAPGNYAVAVVDNTGVWRAKVIHTVVPAL